MPWPAGFFARHTVIEFSVPHMLVRHVGSYFKRRTRAGFVATTRIEHHDLGVVWNSPLDQGGVVVRHGIVITGNAETILRG